MTHQGAAGWYPDPLKPERLRYWDGAEWSDRTALVDDAVSHIVAPAAVSPAEGESAVPDPHVFPESGQRRKPSAAKWVLMAAGAVVIAGVVITASLAFPALVANSTPSPSPSKTSRITADGQLPADATDEEIQEYIDSQPPLADADDASPEHATDEWMEGQGYETAISGNVYIRTLSTSEFTCGYLSCLYYAVYVEKGCPTGVFIQGSIDAQGTSVGPVNAHTAALEAKSSATFGFEDYTGQGDGFHITGVTCYP